MNLCTTILTGQRLHLLHRTITSVLQHAPECFEGRVVCLVNGEDPQTLDAVRHLAFVDEILTSPQRLLGIGEATSRLMERVGPHETVLHLEDDWECQEGDFVGPALEALADPQVGQVRLRSREDRVMGTHMVDGHVLMWEDHGSYETCVAHWTFNPTIAHAPVLNHVFPADSEYHAAQRFLGTRLRVAQLNPGAFTHIGGNDSLRLRASPQEGVSL